MNTISFRANESTSLPRRTKLTKLPGNKEARRKLNAQLKELVEVRLVTACFVFYCIC